MHPWRKKGKFDYIGLKNQKALLHFTMKKEGPRDLEGGSISQFHDSEMILTFKEKFSNHYQTIFIMMLGKELWIYDEPNIHL